VPQSSTLFGRITNSKWAEPVYLFLVCAVTLIYRGHELLVKSIQGVPPTEHISYDGVYYAQIARNIVSGDGLGWEAMIFPVLQPIIVSGLSLVTGLSNYVHLAKMTNLFAGALTLIPAYYIGRELFGRKAAVAATLLMITYPHLTAISTSDTAESLYSLVVFVAVWTSMWAVREYRPWRLALAGCAFGVSYLARPEGLLVFAAFVPVALYVLYKKAGMGKSVVCMAAAVAVFVAVSAPYVYFLSDSYGRFTTSSKLPYESIKMKQAVMGMELDNSDVYSIKPSGRLAWMEDGGAHLIIGYIKHDPAKLFGSYFTNLVSELPWKVGNSSHMRGFPQVYPLYFWIPAIIGFGFLVLDRERRTGAALILLPFVNMFVYPVFTGGFWVYHVPYVPAIAILAAGGVAAAFRAFGLDKRPLAGAFAVIVLSWCVYSVNLTNSIEPMNDGYIRLKAALSDESMKVGGELRNTFGTDVTYMSRWSRVVYYMGGRWEDLPSGNNFEIIQYARNNGVDFIVEEYQGDEVGRDFRFFGMPGMLTEVFSYRSPRAPYAIAVWKVNNG
jgi:4-amino-4-deoxy-L-arabinose transferase-like glycosyltransferase